MNTELEAVLERASVAALAALDALYAIATPLNVGAGDRKPDPSISLAENQRLNFAAAIEKRWKDAWDVFKEFDDALLRARVRLTDEQLAPLRAVDERVQGLLRAQHIYATKGIYDSRSRLTARARET